MRLVRRLIGVICGTAGLIGLLLCMAGIVGCWVAYSDVNRRIDRVFGRADNSLVQANENLGKVSSRLSETKTELAALRKRESEMASRSASDKSARRLLSKKAAASFSPQLVEARQRLVQATEITLVVNGLLEALAEFPLTERVHIDVDRLQSASDQLTELNERSTKLVALLGKAAPEENREIEGESTRAGEILDRVLVVVEEGSNRFNSARETVGRGHSRVSRWLDRLAIAIAIIAIWIGTGQLSLLVHGKRLIFASKETP